jgi:hypothetical protein
MIRAGEPPSAHIGKAGVDRVLDVLGGGAMMNIMPPFGFLSESALLFLYLAVLIIITICMLFAPVVTRDTMMGVRALQYSGRAGRKVLRLQFFAGLTAAVIIALIEIGAAVAVFGAGVWGSFWDSGLHSFLNVGEFYWFDGTFAQWVFCCSAMIVCISIAAMCVVFVISKKASNYITLLLGLIPAMAVFVGVCVVVFSAPFGVTNSEGQLPLYEYVPIPFAEAYVCGALLIGGIAAVCIMLRRQRRAEIV